MRKEWLFASQVEGAGGGAGLDYSTYALLFSISRRINTAYTGALFRVVRDSDSAELDIGYDSFNDMDASALAAFCSGTTGRIQTLYNQGTAGSTFDATYYTGTRSIIYQSGAVETVNGKPAILGQTGNGYRTGLLPIASTIFDQYKILSGVVETANLSNYGLVAGENGTSSGNNRKGLICDTSTSRGLIENVVTSAPISTAHRLLVQATLSQQRQLSFINFDSSLSVVPSISYWNGVLQQQRNFGIGYGDNTDFYFYMMRYSNFTFLGRFQEFALKTFDGLSDDETELRALEAEQNAYYSIY